MKRHKLAIILASAMALLPQVNLRAQESAREVLITNSSDIEEEIDKHIPVTLVREYVHFLTTRGDKETATRDAQRQLVADPRSLNDRDLCSLIEFKNSYEGRSPKKPDEFISYLAFWNRFLDVGKEVGYIPDQIVANLNIGSVWGKVEEAFGERPIKSVRHLRQAEDLAGRCEEDSWVTLRDYMHQEHPERYGAPFRIKPDKPEKLKPSKEEVLGRTYMRMGDLLVSKKQYPEYFEEGIGAYIEGTLVTTNRACASSLLPYRRKEQREQVKALIEKGLQRRNEKGYELLMQVKEMYSEIEQDDKK